MYNFFFKFEILTENSVDQDQLLPHNVSVQNENESVHEISNNVLCVTGKASDQPAHSGSLISVFASSLSIL